MKTKKALIEGLVSTAQRTKAIAVSGIGDRIWKNPAMLNGAKVIRDVVANRKPKPPLVDSETEQAWNEIRGLMNADKSNQE